MALRGMYQRLCNYVNILILLNIVRSYLRSLISLIRRNGYDQHQKYKWSCECNKGYLTITPEVKTKEGYMSDIFPWTYVGQTSHGEGRE